MTKETEKILKPNTLTRNAICAVLGCSDKALQDMIERIKANESGHTCYLRQDSNLEAFDYIEKFEDNFEREVVRCYYDGCDYRVLTFNTNKLFKTILDVYTNFYVIEKREIVKQLIYITYRNVFKNRNINIFSDLNIYPYTDLEEQEQIMEFINKSFADLYINLQFLGYGSNYIFTDGLFRYRFKLEELIK